MRSERANVGAVCSQSWNTRTRTGPGSQGDAQPEAVAEHRDAVAGVLVVARVGVVLPVPAMTGVVRRCVITVVTGVRHGGVSGRGSRRGRRALRVRRPCREPRPKAECGRAPGGRGPSVLLDSALKPTYGYSSTCLTVRSFRDIRLIRHLSREPQASVAASAVDPLDGR